MPNFEHNLKSKAEKQAFRYNKLLACREGYIGLPKLESSACNKYICQFMTKIFGLLPCRCKLFVLRFLKLNIKKSKQNNFNYQKGDPTGSYNNTCKPNGGQCHCKLNTDNRDCNHCKINAWDFSPNGCRR
jgi:hypothetical protein